MNKTNINSADSDQKLIEDRVYLEIEDKGATATERIREVAEESVENANKEKADAEAAAVMMDSPVIDEPVKKKKWGAWWAAALFALLAVGCCIYLATRDSKVERQLVDNAAADGPAHAPFTGLKNQVGKVTGTVTAVSNEAIDAVGKAASSAGNTVSGAINGVDVYGKYPMASEDLIDQEASDGRTVDYLYYFANNQSAIPDNAALNEIAEAAKNTNADITITAYASPTGSVAYNDALSEQRAENLENYLVAHGVSADQIKIVNGGQTAQFGSDASNRRAEILVNYGA